MTRLKDNLKQLAKDFDITMAQLARETKVPPQTLNNWLSGVEPRSLSQVKKVADYFDISIDELCFNSKKTLKQFSSLDKYTDEINAGIYEVVLRRIKDKG